MINGYIIVDDDELNSIDIMEVNNVDKNGVKYQEDVYYIGNSVRFKIDDLIKYNQCSLAARDIYTLILSKLKNNTNVLNITRKEIKSILNVSDASISRSIKELLDIGLLKLKDKDIYVIPINKVYKGNVNKIIKAIKEEKEREEQIKREEESKNSINYISNLRKLKLKKK